MNKANKIKVFELNKFDKIANKVSFEAIKKNLFNCDRIDLIPKEMVVKLNIRWGELYCVCDKKEWEELYRILNDANVDIRKVSSFSLIGDIFGFFFIQPIKLIKYYFVGKLR